MLISLVNKTIGEAFSTKGLDHSLSETVASNRPDLSDFQCNGALKLAKSLKRNPREIASDMQEALDEIGIFSKVSIDGPGFVNLSLADHFIVDTLLNNAHLGQSSIQSKKIVLDYGGPNVAKPLHVGHLRSAIIGESIKRIGREIGHDVIADIHLGDWGTPLGMLMAQLEEDHPDWLYFQDDFNGGDHPELSCEEMNMAYPLAAKRFKADEAFAQKARNITAKLQAGHSGYTALWKHAVHLSKESIKQDFEILGVGFDLWLGESDACQYQPDVVKHCNAKGIVTESEGATVIEVAKQDDKHDMPPLILGKSDGAATYATTDLATIYQRVNDFNPDSILYVVDKRQSMHFTQVFRAVSMANIIDEEKLEHIGFGTMNGKDGKPFKTRDGNVMRLSELIQNAKETALTEAGYHKDVTDPEILDMVTRIAVAAIKFGDLSNLRTSDYCFDLKEFLRFDGKTGPYIQYAVVRADAILEKVGEVGNFNVNSFSNKSERELALTLLGFNDALQKAFDKRMPSEVCEYAYELASKFNSFYRDSPIQTESDQGLKNFRAFLTQKTANTLKKALDCLAIQTPKKMLRAAPAEIADNDFADSGFEMTF